MQPDFDICIAERLQHCDLHTLEANHSRQENIQKKCHDAEKESRQDEAVGAKFAEFICQKTKRDLLDRS